MLRFYIYIYSKDTSLTFSSCTTSGHRLATVYWHACNISMLEKNANQRMVAKVVVMGAETDQWATSHNAALPSAL